MALLKDSFTHYDFRVDKRGLILTTCITARSGGRNIMRICVGGILLAALLLGFPVLAQLALPVEQVCGPSSEEVSTSEKANLDAKAQTLFKIGSVSLQGAAERTRTEIMVNSKRSDAARLILYLKRISCILIYQDTSLSTDEKLQRIEALQSGLTLPPAGEVPMLYNFAIDAGQIPPPNSTIPFAAPDLPSQKLALLQVTDWRAVTLVGERYIDRQCDQFITTLHDVEWSKKTTPANLNTIQATTVGIMGLALAAQNTIGIVGIAFGLAASSFDTTASTVLYQLPASGVTSIAAAQQQYLRANEAATLSSVSNQSLAVARLNEYLHYCVPATIEENITKVLNNTRGTEAGIETSLTTPAVIPLFVHDEPLKQSLPTGRSKSKRMR